MKSNYVAFSLWNSVDFDLVILLRNAELIKRIHPGWKIIIYHDQTVPVSVLTKLENLEVILVDMSLSAMHPPLWKFMASNLPDANYVIFSDWETGSSMDAKGDLLKQIQRSGSEWGTTSRGELGELPVNNKNSAVLSFICSLMVPVVELKRLIGGF